MNLENDLLHAFDMVLHQDYPNPERTDCPGCSVLKRLAAEPEAAQSASTLAHIRQCAPCFDELKELRPRHTHRSLSGHPK